MREADDLSGVVVELLPGGMCVVSLEGGARVVAHLAMVERGVAGRVLVGVEVRVRLSPLQPGRGRIVKVVG